MKKLTPAILLLALALPLSGCGKLFGGVDDTVLPGAREDAIPGQTKFPAPGDDAGIDTAGNGAADAPPATTDAQAPAVDCSLKKNAADPACADASSGDGTFSDGQ
jgi:hypothetical protein